jgi:hypothetical protein
MACNPILSETAIDLRASLYKSGDLVSWNLKKSARYFRCSAAQVQGAERSEAHTWQFAAVARKSWQFS